jgi:hypothetical protein
MTEHPYEVARQRQRFAEALIQMFTPEQKASYAEWCEAMGFTDSPYDWPGWAEFPDFQDPRDGWSR